METGAHDRLLMETSKEGCLKGGRANVTSFQVSSCNLQLIHPPLSQFVCDRISVGQFGL